MAFPPASGSSWTSKKYNFTTYPEYLWYISDTLIICSFNETLFTWNPSTNAVATIGDSSDFGISNYDLFWVIHNGNVIARVTDTDGSSPYDVKVMKYVLATDTWSTLYETTTNLASTGIIYTDRTHLYTTFDSTIYKSSDGGETWTDAGLDGGYLHTPSSHFGVPRDVMVDDGYVYFMQIDTDNGLYKYNKAKDGTITLIGTSTTPYIKRTPGYFWKASGSGYNATWKYATTFGTWVSPSNDTILPMNVCNYSKTFGSFWTPVGGNYRTTVYFWDDGSNQWSATSDTQDTTQHFRHSYIVLSDGTVYAGAKYSSQEYFRVRGDTVDTTYVGIYVESLSNDVTHSSGGIPGSILVNS